MSPIAAENVQSEPRSLSNPLAASPRFFTQIGTFLSKFPFGFPFSQHLQPSTLHPTAQQQPLQEQQHATQPIIVHHQELFNPDLAGIQFPDDALDPDVTHLSLPSHHTISHHTVSGYHVPKFEAHHYIRNKFDHTHGDVPKPIHTLDSHNTAHTNRVHPVLLSPYIPQSHHTSMLTPFSTSSYPFPFTPNYNVSPNIVDQRSQRSPIRDLRTSVQSFYQKSTTTLRLPVALISFNPRYLTKSIVLSRFGRLAREDSPNGVNRFDRKTLQHRPLFSDNHDPNSRVTNLRRPLLSPTNSNTQNNRRGTTGSGYTNTFDMNYSHNSPSRHRHDSTGPVDDTTRLSLLTTNKDTRPSDLQSTGLSQTSLAYSTSLLQDSSSLHEAGAHLSTDLLNEHDVRARTEACRYVSCQRLAAVCAVGPDLHQHQPRNKRQLAVDDLSFTCGLYEVCCSLPVAPVARPIASAPSGGGGGSSCGRSSQVTLAGRISSAGQVLEGDAAFGEYPWQAAVLRKEGVDNVYVCAGTLVDATHVLTAAHCITGYHASEMRVRFGEYDVNRDSEFYTHFETDVAAMFVHPEFYPGNLLNDIALLKIHQPVDFNANPHISPVCLPRAGDLFAGHRCWVTGWGKDGFISSARYQNILKEVEVPVLTDTDCVNRLRTTRLGPTYALHPGMLCAGGEPGKDACKGDGGGPLTCVDTSGRHRLAGLVSWGIGCGTPGIPGVYVNVQHYLEWILRVAL